MIVHCENCGTKFGFDDKQIGEGVTVRCSVCKHVFKVESASASASAQPAGWQIRTTDATSFTAPDVATLRQWIDEGRLTADDEVSRTGRSWVRLGAMPEFSAAFAKFQDVAPVVKEVVPPPVRRPVAPPPTTPAAHAMAARQSPPPSAVATVPPPAPAPGPVAASLVAGPAPQSARPTVSPPRSVPAQQAAPVSREPAPAPAPEPVIQDDGPTKVRRRAKEDFRDFDDDDDDDDDDDEVEEVEADFADDGLDAFDGGPAERRGVSGGLIALIGVVAVVGVVFGVPQLRAKVLGALSGDTSGAQQQPSARPEIAAAEKATNTLGTASLAVAEAELQRAMDAGDADAATQAAMKVALADLLSSRAIAYEIAAALDEAQREDFRRRAAEDQEDGERLIDGLEGGADLDRLGEVRALVRLAAGRAEAEVLPQVPEGAAETELIVKTAVLWQDLDAPVPPGLLGGLQALTERSGLGDSALGLALLRAGDETAARNLAERLLVGAEDQIVAVAIQSRLGAGADTADAAQDGETGAQMGAETGGEDGEPEVAKPPPPPTEEGGDEGGEGGGGGGGGGSSFERMLERGCEQVSSGDASGGIKTLLRAFDREPKNIDVLVCLAQGYAAEGNNARADMFFTRALDQSPNNKSALRGAAKIAAQTGATKRATELYERLLQVDPNNAAAKAYLAKNAPSQPEPTPTPEPEPAPAPAPVAEGG